MEIKVKGKIKQEQGRFYIWDLIRHYRIKEKHCTNKWFSS